MNYLSRAAALLLLFSSAFLLGSCGDRAAGNTAASRPANSSPDSVDSARTNVEELSLLIKIPYEAEDIYWKENKAERKVTAVLRFDKADTDKLAADLEKAGAGQDVEIESEDWFPDELRSQSEMKGDTALKGSAFAATQFYLEPYTDGKITRIVGTDFFVLELKAR